MKNKRVLRRCLLLLGFLFVGLFTVAHGQTLQCPEVELPGGATIYLDAPGGQNDFQAAIADASSYNTFSPRYAGSGDTVTISGEGFDVLPRQGLVAMIVASGAECRAADSILPAENRARFVPVTWVSDTTLEFQIPADIPMYVREGGVHVPGELSINLWDIIYVPGFSQLQAAQGSGPITTIPQEYCMHDHLSILPTAFGTQPCIPPVPASSRPAPVSNARILPPTQDTKVKLSWDYPNNPSIPIDGFRVFTPSYARYSTANPPNVNSIHSDSWVELTGQGNYIPADQRNVEIYADRSFSSQSHVPRPTFAGEVLYYAIVAQSFSRGSSDPVLFYRQIPNAIGCYEENSQPPPLAPVIISMTRIHDPDTGGYFRSPFPEGSGTTVTLNGVARASFDYPRLPEFPILENYDSALGFLPNYRITPDVASFTWNAVAHSTPGNTHYSLDLARGLACRATRDSEGNCPTAPSVVEPGIALEQDANIVIDARFGDASLGGPFYITAHLFNNHSNYADYDPRLPDDSVVPVALVAGQAIADQADTIGMVALQPNAYITGGRLPDLDPNTGEQTAAGFINGNVSGEVVFIQLEDAEHLPGQYTDDGSGNPVLGNTSGQVITWKSRITMSFTELPLHLHRCQQ